MINVNNIIEELLNKDNKSIILFGASNFAEKAIKFLEDKKITIKYLCDNDKNKWGVEIKGYKIISPDELLNLEDIRVIITSIYYKEIKEQLKEMKIQEIYDMNKIIHFLKYKNEIERLNDTLNDLKSKHIVENIIKFRISNDMEYIDEIKEDNQYFIDEIIKLSENEIFVDGGAYTADTTLEFLKRVNYKFKYIYMFEPQENNYSVLKETIEKLNDGSISAYQKGLYKENAVLKFNNDMGSGSRIDEKSEEKIEVISIDDFLVDIPISFIKMDIEGAEFDALFGAENTIIKNNPKLAICLYHKPEDLWRIPLFLKWLVPEYHIYIRHHDNIYDYETVCYAIKE